MAALARDPGLQTQRTALAWSRTALAAWVNALLVLRAALVLDHPVGPAPILAFAGLMVVAASTLTLAAWWRRPTLDESLRQGAPHPMAMLVAGGAAALASAAGAIFVAWQVLSA